MKQDNKNERSGRLASAFGQIEEELINEAENYKAAPKAVKRNTNRIIRPALIAASVLVLVTGGIFAGKILKKSTSFEPVTKPEPIILSGSAYYSDAAAELPDELKSINVTADGMTSRMISPDAALIVTTAGKTDTETLVQYLSVSPEIPVSVTQKSDTEFMITPVSGGFAPGTVYNLKLGDPENPALSYAFQTESELIVKTLLPADKGINVPVNTGIEITFSESIESAGTISDYFTITPSVNGEWKLYPDGRTVAFIPKNDLKFNSEYEYTIKAGLKSVSGRELKESISVRFRTEAEAIDSDNGYIYMSAAAKFSDFSACFNSEENPYVNINISGYKLKSDISLVMYLYKFASADEAYRAIKQAEMSKKDGIAEIPTSGLVHITDIKETAVSGEYTSKTFVLPSGLEKGIYLIKVTASATGGRKKGITVSADYFIQVTDLEAFTVSSDGKTLVYLYDTLRDASVTGAAITGERYTPADWWNNDPADFSEAVFTDSGNGIYVTDNGKDSCVLMKTSCGDNSLLICASSAAEDTGNYTMKYMYTDREVYFSNDTVNFWGFLAPAYADSVLPQVLYLQSGNSSVRTPVTVDSDGFFRGSFKVEDMRESTLSLKITDADGLAIASKYITITEEEKPQITASLSFDKLFYRYGETVKITLKASFFDGTPAQGLEFYFNTYDFSLSTNSGITDENGEITVSVKTGMPSRVYSTDPGTYTVYAQLVGFETQTLNITGSFTYFHSDYIFKTVWDSTSRQLTLNNLDTSSLKTESDLTYPAFPGNTVGTPADGKVTYELIKYVITKKEVRKYDSYTKKAYTTYEYNTSESVEKKGEFEFKNGVIDLPMYEVNGFTGGYYYEICYDDGRTIYETSVSAVKNSKVVNSSAYNSPVYTLKLGQDQYIPGDRIDAVLTLNGETVENVFWVLTADGIKSFYAGSSFSETFTEDMIPGNMLYAIYYDEASGSFTYAACKAPYDYSSNASLNIEIIPDKTSYKPGEEAKVTVRVTDSEGKPVSSGKILLSIVDEACFALGNQTVNVPDTFFASLGKEGLSSIGYYYYDYYYGNYRTQQKTVLLNSRRSVQSILQEPSARKEWFYGATGMPEANEAPYDSDSDKAKEQSDGTYIRENFSDNPEFAVIDIGTDGTAVYIFRIPDNITSWRITSCAVSGTGSLSDMKVGNAVTDVICTQSFFINTGVCTRYIEGDDVSLSARSYGTDASGKVKYTAVLYGYDGTEIKTVSDSSDAAKHAWLNFGKLSEGSYSAVITASCGKLSDAVRVTFDVTVTAAVTDVSKDITPEELRNLRPLLYPLTLTFHSKAGGYDEVSCILSRLLYKDDAGRSDSLAARFTALLVYEKLYGQGLSENADDLKTMFRNYVTGSGVSLLQYSSSDIELTARVLAVCPDIMDSAAREQIISNCISELGKLTAEDDVTLCASLLCLSSLGEPVLDRLYSVTAQAKNYSLEAKLYLCASFAAIGDYSAAYDIWSQLKEEYGISDTEYGTLYINADSLQERVRYTSLALIACSRISKTDASALAGYLLDNITRDESDSLALAAYIKFFAPASGNDSVMSVTYVLGGKEETVEISRGKMYTLNLTKSEFADFSIKSIDDGITVHATYGGTAEEAYADKVDSSRVTIDKKITSAGNGMYDVTLSIKGTSTRVSEYFTISDWIPSGARYFTTRYGNSGSREGNVSVWAYICNSKGQQMNGYVSIYNNAYKNQLRSGKYENTCPEYSFSIEISYRIRGAVAGEFVIEPAIISNPSTSLYSVSERMTVVIADPSSNSWKIKK